jgi:Ca2+-binding RTX toxin-like protein
MPTFHGTALTDFIEGFNDDISDTIYGYGGADWLWGKSGNDYLIGGAGGDYLNGGVGAGDAALYDDSDAGVTVNLATGIGFGGTAQGDTLVDIERLFGSVHGDALTGDDEQNDLFGGDGDDTLHGGGERDDLFGGDGNDTLYGDAHADMLSGDDDNDTLKGGGGADVLSGGSGTDTASYIGSLQGVSISLQAGVAEGGEAAGDTFSSIENLAGSAYRDELWGDGYANVIRGMNGNDTLKGAGGTDTLWGGNGDDELFGNDDADTLRGEAGNDVLDGGAGFDTMAGGLDDDIYYVDQAFEVVNESAGQGIDEVRASGSYNLTAGADVETLRTTNDNGVAAINLIGNASGNHIIGNNGVNYLDGRGGTDQLEGRGGDDHYIVDSADTITESGGEGNDTVLATVSYTLNAGADVETLQTTNPSFTTAINLTGNDTGNVVRGNSGNNVLNGGGGNDELTGYGGQDMFLFDTALNAATNVDVITDFNVADDTIVLDDAIFSSSLGPGNISAGEFVIGAAALDANDRIIYNSNTGALLYDSDGNGAGAAIQFAALGSGLALTNLDFFVV